MLGNWIDLIIIFYLLVHFISGARKGFLSILINMVSFIASLLLAFFTYAYSAEFLVNNFSINGAYANVIGFFVNIFVAKVIISLLIYSVLPRALFVINNSVLSRVAGGLVSFAYGAVVVFLIFSITFSFSLPYFITNELNSSTAGRFIASDPLKLNDSLRNIFGDVLQTTVSKLDFLTVGTEDKEKINLDFKVDDLKFDERLEEDMLKLVNKERMSRGFSELVMNDEIREVARKHGVDMFENGYFSHINLEGKGPSERMKEGGIKFSLSGENLALSKDLESAHKGLMNSPGHKKNILFPFFHRVGIGVIDGGPYGIIFVQNFAD